VQARAPLLLVVGCWLLVAARHWVQMQVPDPIIIERDNLDASVAEVPNADAVFVVWAGDQSAYLAKTSMLRRRLLRIFKAVDSPRRSLNLREVATRVEYWPTASRFESMLVHYALARRYFPEDYLRMIKLRMPAYVKLILANEFPRTQVSTRLSASRALHYGPFQSRAAAELFENQFLDLFQIRRCQENLEPSPQHPGCIYGEMNRCLRPCQQVVTRDEYLSEVVRVEEFLRGNGAGLLSVATAARDRLSAEMNFEEAARQHKQLERVQEVVALRGDLVCDIERLYGVAIAPSLAADSVLLWFVCQGAWQAPVKFPLTSMISLDQRLRELVGSIKPMVPSLAEKQEHLALLARWHYSTWSDGEWIGFPALDQAPYKRLVRAISRVRQKAASVEPSPS
jgi:excinuclease ABC subunit C